MSEKPDGGTLAIHEDALESDAKGQPQLMFVWGTKLAEARREVSITKNRLKLVAAGIDNAVRAAPAEFGLEKITEKGVESAVLMDQDYQQAQRDLTDAELEEGVLDAFVKALRERGEAIRVMASLHGQMYWSKPDALQEVAKKVGPRKPKTMRG